MLKTHEHQPVIIHPDLAGIPGVAHGGYLSGLIASALEADPVEVELRRAAPLGRELTLERVGADLVELRDGERVLAEGAPTRLELDVPPPVSLGEAETASRDFPGHGRHLFPGCFACGTERNGSEGLRIHPGPVAGRRLVAAPWVPGAGTADSSGRVRAEFVWAALDCPQLWSLVVHAPSGTPDRVVTAALAAKRARPVIAGEPHVVIGWPIGREGRRWLAGAAIFGPDGELCAVGSQTAAVTDWGVPLGLDHWAAD